jgi:hypothetical protein
MIKWFKETSSTYENATIVGVVPRKVDSGQLARETTYALGKYLALWVYLVHILIAQVISQNLNSMWLGLHRSMRRSQSASFLHPKQ